MSKAITKDNAQKVDETKFQSHWNNTGETLANAPRRGHRALETSNLNRREQTNKEYKEDSALNAIQINPD